MRGKCMRLYHAEQESVRYELYTPDG